MSKKIWTKEQAIDHINANIVINDAGCHVWTGPKTRDGYGQVGVAGLYETFGIKGIHRLIVHLVHGYDFTSRHEQVMHACHNRACCNPDHLSVGTATENMAAAKARGSWTGRFGGNAKLTEDDVREIKRMMALGYRNAVIIPLYPQVTKCAISSIRTGRAWSSIALDETEVDYSRLRKSMR